VENNIFSLIPIVIVLLIIVIRFLHVKENEELQERAYSISGKNNKKSKNEKEIEEKKKNNNNNSSRSNNYFINSPNVKNAFFKSLDIRGVVALAVTITLFLNTLTYMENDDAEKESAAGDDNLILIIGLLGSAVVSLILFIVAEKKATSPIVDLKLIVNKTIFPILIMFLLLGFTMFMIYQTVPILVTAPIPLGFGGSAITSSFVLLPFTLVFLVLSPTVGIMVGKFGNIKLFIAGSVISAIGYFSIFIFHSTELEVSVSLAIVSTGLALLNTIGMNIVMLSTPKQFGGITIGMVQVLMFIGMSIGPVVGGMYMQRYQESSVVDAISTSFPSPVAYDLIFLTASTASLSFVVLAIILKRENPSSIADPIRTQ
jgi:hypothetical protein